MSDNPIRQSGFSGGDERWRREREPILEALREPGGDFLDVCCANGYLLECLVKWAHDRGLDVVPFGIDQGSRLIEVARKRVPHFAGHFRVANAWDWKPPRRYRYVYAFVGLRSRRISPRIHSPLDRSLCTKGWSLDSGRLRQPLASTATLRLGEVPAVRWVSVERHCLGRNSRSCAFCLARSQRLRLMKRFT